jgi:hypothetical protein
MEPGSDANSKIEGSGNAQSSQRDRALKAASLSRTLKTRPELMESFCQSFAQAESNGQAGQPLTADLFAQYSATAMKTPDANSRFTDQRSRSAVQNLIDNFYQHIEADGGLYLENLAEFYDGVNLREPLVDGNKRASILALTHVLSQYGYPAPDFTLPHETLAQLQQKFPGEHVKAAESFLDVALRGLVPKK